MNDLGHHVKWNRVKVVQGQDAISSCGQGIFVDAEDKLVFVGGHGRTGLRLAHGRVDSDISQVRIENVNLVQVSESKRDGKSGTAIVYCSKEKVVFMHGGIDGNVNDSSTRFVIISDNNNHEECVVKTLCGDSPGPSPRGYHSAVYVPSSDPSKGSQVFTFGGQFCTEGHFTFLNDLFCLELKTMEWKRMVCSGTPPSPRSQSLCFEYKDSIYVFGGYDGRSIFTDLHKICLKSMIWSKVTTSGDGPVGLKSLVPLDFHVYQCRPPGLVLGKHLILLAENFLTLTFHTFILNMKTMTWTSSSTSSTKRSRLEPPAGGNPTLLLSQNKILLVGGDPREPEKWDTTRLWHLSLPCSMPWQVERVLWIGCLKNDPMDCLLARLPPHIIYHIIRFVNSNSINLK